MPKRDRYHHGDLRQELIHAAIASIEDGELTQLSLRGLARRLGVSHNAPYRHFPDKDALLSAVATQGFETLRSVMEQSLETVPSKSTERLLAIGRAYIQFTWEHPTHYRLMFGAYSTPQDNRLDAAAQQAFQVLENVIRQGQVEGVFRANDPHQLAQVAWAIVHGIAMLRLDGRLTLGQEDSFDSFSQFALQLSIEGFAGDSRTV
jgi:AcrR family transcriptional regulator